MSKRPLENDDEGEEEGSEGKRGEKMDIRVTRSSLFFTGKGSVIKKSQSSSTVSFYGIGGCGGGGGGGVLATSSCCCCQVEECEKELSEAKQYYKRHRVCEEHVKAAVVLFKGTLQRFCQRCSKFHVLSEFDDEKRSCRQRLASHKRRRWLTNAVHELRAKGGGGGTKVAMKI